MVWPTLRVFRSQSRLTFLVFALVLQLGCCAPKARHPHWLPGRTPAKSRPVDALRRVDDLHPFVAFRKMTEFRADRLGQSCRWSSVVDRQGGKFRAGRTELAPPL